MKKLIYFLALCLCLNGTLAMAEGEAAPSAEGEPPAVEAVDDSEAQAEEARKAAEAEEARKAAEAEEAVKAWCRELGAEGLGLMFLELGEGDPRLTPLVYIPGSGTLFWENSCASGSSAAGMALAAENGRALRLTLEQPGGRLQVESDPESGETWLYGRTALLGQYDTEIRG